MTQHIKVIVVSRLSILLVIAIIVLLTWVFYEYVVKNHIGCTELNIWGKLLVINSSLNIVMFGLTLVAHMIISSKYD